MQIKVLSRIMDHLATGGYLFIGHAENILGHPLPLEKKGPNIFKKTNDEQNSTNGKV